jgi:hypothetical protein
MRVLLATVLAIAAAAAVGPATVIGAVAATAVTGPAEDIRSNTATLTGTVNAEGVATDYRFEYGTTTAYGLTTEPPQTATGTQPTAARASISNLSANTEYHYRLVAGAATGADRTFRTGPNPSPPAISDQRTSNIGVDSVTVGGRIDANDGPTTYFVEYGLTTRYGSETDPEPAGDGDDPVPVSATLTGLQPRRRYNWRLVATNPAGTTRGRNRTFTTARLPTGITLALAPPRVTWGTGLTLGGRVSGIGVDRIPLALEAQRFPFDAGFAEVARRTSGNDGGYAFQVANQWTTTRYRVVTRTRVVTYSPVAESLSAARVGVRLRHASSRRARFEGSVLPATTGRLSLQRQSRSGRWAPVRRKAIAPTDKLRSRYRFSIARMRSERRYRVVVVPDPGGAYVRGVSREVTVRARPRR